MQTYIEIQRYIHFKYVCMYVCIISSTQKTFIFVNLVVGNLGSMYVIVCMLCMYMYVCMYVCKEREAGRRRKQSHILLPVV